MVRTGDGEGMKEIIIAIIIALAIVAHGFLLKTIRVNHYELRARFVPR